MAAVGTGTSSLPATSTVPSYVPVAYRPWVLQAAAATGLPASVVAAQINTESGFNTGATSPTGAQGIAQIEPETWDGLGISGSPYNANDALEGYVSIMSSNLKRYGGNIREALAAYNAGAGNIAAGYGYADSILSNAGVGSSATAGAGSTSTPATSTSSGSGSLASGLSGFLLEAVLTIALIGTGLWLAFVGARGTVSYRRAPA